MHVSILSLHVFWLLFCGLGIIVCGVFLTSFCIHYIGFLNVGSIFCYKVVISCIDSFSVSMSDAGISEGVDKVDDDNRLATTTEVKSPNDEVSDVILNIFIVFQFSYLKFFLVTDITYTDYCCSSATGRTE